MTEINPDALRQARDEAEATRDEVLSPDATRPARAKVLSIRLNPDEFEALNRHAEQLDRIARDIEQLRRKLVS